MEKKYKEKKAKIKDIQNLTLTSLMKGNTVNKGQRRLEMTKEGKIEKKG